MKWSKARAFCALKNLTRVACTAGLLALMWKSFHTSSRAQAPELSRNNPQETIVARMYATASGFEQKLLEQEKQEHTSRARSETHLQKTHLQSEWRSKKSQKPRCFALDSEIRDPDILNFLSPEELLRMQRQSRRTKRNCVK